MNENAEKKFLIIAPIMGGVYYWMSPGQGNTEDVDKAHRYGERQARELCEKEPLLKMIPEEERE